MNRCEHFEHRMVEHLYGELDEAGRRNFEEHLRECESCTALLAEMQGTVETMNRRHRPDPGGRFWDGYWQRLEERVAREEVVADASRFTRRWSPGSWGYRAAAAVIVLAAGIWIGRTVLAPGTRTLQPAPETAAVSPAESPLEKKSEPATGSAVQSDEAELAARSQPIDAPAGEARGSRPATRGAGPERLAAASADDEALRYIGRSQVVLLALLNGGGADGSPADFGAERAQARVLLADGQRIQDGLTRPEDRRLRELVAQLELILREIANLEAESDLDAVDMIRSRVDREGVMLRIDLQQMRGASAGEPREAKEHEAFD